MKTALALRHIHFEDLGTLEPLLRERGFDVRYLDPAADDLAREEAAASDLLIALGGPIGAFDERAYPFLADELRLLERRLASGRPLLGICLGAQLIARLLGAAVTPMGFKEIGFGALTLTDAGRRSVLAPLLACRCCIGTATASNCLRAVNCWRAPKAARSRHTRLATGCWVCSSTWKPMPAESNAGWSAIAASWARPASIRARCARMPSGMGQR